jgi:hypothetical protein
MISQLAQDYGRLFTFDITNMFVLENYKIRIKVGNLYLNEASVNGDLNMFMYKKIRAASGMNKL